MDTMDTMTITAGTYEAKCPTAGGYYEPATVVGTIAAGSTVKITSGARMSNRQYYRHGQVKWWARIGDDFLKIPYTRGDYHVEFSYQIPSDAEGQIEINIGAGKWLGGVREVITLALAPEALAG